MYAMDKLLEIGKIVNTHGLKGEVKVTPWCDDVKVFNELDSVLINGNTFGIENVKFVKNSVILRLTGVESIEKAEGMRNNILCVERSRLGELPQNTFYVKDLIGIEVYTDDTLLGVVDDCFKTGSNDVYVVRSVDGKQILLPAIKQVVKRVDIEGRRMDAELMEGLIDED